MTEPQDLKPADFLTFRAPGRLLVLEEIAGEFVQMKKHLNGRELTVEVAKRVCTKSGTHLLKMVSPRVDGDHACLYIEPSNSNARPKILPSTNAPDIPFCKVLFRPLEILDHSTASVIDHVMNPEDASAKVLEAFASVFGVEILDVVKQTLLDSARRVTKLASGEFPIIYVPRVGGGDLQITPVAPASAFNGMRAATGGFFLEQEENKPKVSRGKFHKQAISGKPQNISGAIGGTRTRLLAEMPAVFARDDAEIYRFVQGGSFPRWRDSSVATWVLKYADMLTADAEYNNQNTRNALDRTADRLIDEASNFIGETNAEIQIALGKLSDTSVALASPPDAVKVLLRRYWSEDDLYKARRALSSSHFQYRIAQSRAPLSEVAQ